MLNRLIIVGNGFDLAHGLKTKYSDYIQHYWENCTYDDIFIKLFFTTPKNLKNFSDLLRFLEVSHGLSLVKKGSYYKYNTENILEIKNDFFHWINKIKFFKCYYD